MPRRLEASTTDDASALTAWEKFWLAVPAGALLVALIAALCLVGTAMVPHWAWRS
jgi:hypothetical protein